MKIKILKTQTNVRQLRALIHNQSERALGPHFHLLCRGLQYMHLCILHVCRRRNQQYASDEPSRFYGNFDEIVHGASSAGMGADNAGISAVTGVSVTRKTIITCKSKDDLCPNTHGIVDSYLCTVPFLAFFRSKLYHLSVVLRNAQRALQDGQRRGDILPGAWKPFVVARARTGHIFSEGNAVYDIDFCLAGLSARIT